MVDTSQNSSREVTLDDGLWKDSFDKLLEPRPMLRELNIIKNNVRASFNIDSSIENCSREDSELLTVPEVARNNNQNLHKPRATDAVSTPVTKRINDLNPFKCSLSPIVAWKFRYFDKKEPKKTLQNINEKLESTPVNSEHSIADYERDVAPTLAPSLIPTVQNVPKNSLKQRKTYITPEINIIDYELGPNVPSKPTDSFLFTEPIKVSGKPRNSKRKHTGCRVAFESAVNIPIVEIEKSAARPKRRVQSTRSCRKVAAQSADNGQQQESSFRHSMPNRDKLPSKDHSIILQPGKWRKTLSIWRRTYGTENRKIADLPQPDNIDQSVEFVGITRVVGKRKSVYLKAERQSDANSGKSWEQRVLEYCNQQMLLHFSKLYESDKMLKCRKIGEGAFGEVFTYASRSRRAADVVIKIIPIEGDEKINGEVQKTFEQILPEIIITTELSNLNDAERQSNATCGFVSIKKVACVKGKYPMHLINLWEDYDNDKGSENDNPRMFTDAQLFIVLELGFSGHDLESFIFDNAKQAYYALQQVILTLAVAEEVYQFEHRDLHWGNVLVNTTKAKYLTYKLHNKELTIPTFGVKLTIIDYTLSRMTFNDCCLYNDLSSDEELFTATGDYQYDIYRMMRDALKNNWETYEPKTNIFWISYVIAKMLDGVSYKSTQTKTHSSFIDKLQKLFGIVLTLNSATEFANYLQDIE